MILSAVKVSTEIKMDINFRKGREIVAEAENGLE